MDANLAAFLGLIVTSLTSIALAVINWKKSAAIEKKVDAGNEVGSATHNIANGRTEKLLNDLAQANKEIARLSLLAPPPDDKP